MAQADFLTPIDSLARGTAHAGFTVTDVIPLPELSGTTYVLTHDATSARALWLACADDNKAFSIAFKTPPSDSTGVFHILEHSLLCGSDKYPVKEPFVNLLKTSMQTFLNALTFGDKTMYPVASTNTADLENLMDVYLDAVLHPAIYGRPRIFEQEGWHYEYEDGRLTYNGVVFNEMKGALSDPDDVLFEALDRSLFPDTPYRHESGGDPREIVKLTYEQFIDNHSRHYDLANSYTVLYGDMDIERELAFLNERFLAAERRDAGAPNDLPLQAPVAAGLSTVSMDTAPENAEVGLAYVIGTSADRERVLATDVLLDALAGSNEAPLKRAVLESGLGDDFNAILYDGELQPRVVFQLKGAKPGSAKPFRDLVEKTCRDLAEGGIGHDQLAASLAQAEFNLREGDWGSYSDGVALAIQVMSSWLYDDSRPVDYLRYEDELAHMRAGLDKGYFESLLDSLVCQSTHSAEVELVPASEGAAQEEADELAAKQATLSADELDAIVAEVAALRAEQEAPDDPEDLAKLPQLGISDIGPARQEAPATLDEDAPLPCLAHELPTRGIGYAYHYFDLSAHVSFDELPYVAVLTELLGKLGTASHTASELDTLVETNLGNLDFFCETYAVEDGGDSGSETEARPTLVVGASALSQNMERLATLPSEVWSSTDFSDTDRIHALLQQRRILLEQAFTNAGHSAASARLSSYFSPASLVAQNLGGVDYYLFLKDLLADFDNRAGELTQRLEELRQRIFTADNVTVSFIGSAADRAAFWQAGSSLGLSGRGDDLPTLLVPTPEVRNEAFVIPSNVAYVAAGAGRSDADAGDFGTWAVATRALSYDYLWNEVRVKGGAYGVGYRRTRSGLRQFWSYRDPNVDATLDRYAQAADYLAAWDPTEDELAGYVVSTVAGHDAPTKPRQLARRQDVARFSGQPDGWRDAVRDQELSVTVEKVRALADALADLNQRHAVCVFGAEDKIRSSSQDLKVVQLMGDDE